MVEGFSHQLFPLLQLNQNTSVLLPVMSWPRNCSKSCFPGKPHIRKSRRFFSPSLFDCYSRAAWKRLWGFWLGSHPLLAEEATVNPLNSNAKAAWLLICLPPPAPPPQICIKAIKKGYNTALKKTALASICDLLFVLLFCTFIHTGLGHKQPWNTAVDESSSKNIQQLIQPNNRRTRGDYETQNKRVHSAGLTDWCFWTRKSMFIGGDLFTDGKEI